MLNRISNKGIVPRGGFWKYYQPETKETIRSNEWEMFLMKIKQHRRQHNIPIGLGFEAEIEDYVCEHQPEMCEDKDPNVPRVQKLSMGDVLRGMKVIAAFKMAGSPLVSQEEANRRASICAVCRYNVLFSRPCGGLCPELKNLVKAMVGSAKTPYDSDLRSCSICSCYTSVHVWVPMDILDLGLTPEMRTQFQYAKDTQNCWKVLTPAAG